MNAATVKMSIFDVSVTSKNVDRSVDEADRSVNESGKIFYLLQQSGELIEIDPEQLWFWSEEWQTKEREADEQLARGDYEVFESIDDFVNSL